MAREQRGRSGSLKFGAAVGGRLQEAPANLHTGTFQPAGCVLAFGLGFRPLPCTSLTINKATTFGHKRKGCGAAAISHCWLGTRRTDGDIDAEVLPALTRQHKRTRADA